MVNVKRESKDSKESKAIGFVPDLLTQYKLTQVMELLSETNKSNVLRYALVEGLDVLIKRHQEKEEK